jgi:hypothetical protein
LKSTNTEAEVATHPGDIARGTVKTGKVILENLYSVEAGCGDGPELLVESAANRYRGNRTYHVDPLAGRT